MKAPSSNIAQLRAEARQLMGITHRLRVAFEDEPSFGPVVGLLARIDKVLTKRLKEEQDHATQ